MRLGYSISSAQPLDLSPTEAGETLLERARIATEAGIDYVQAGDHHVIADNHYFQNVPTLARMTEYVDYVAPLFLLPLHNPVTVAEYCGTLAAFADRFDLWCAVGYNEEAFDTFDVPMSERAPRFEESLGLIEALSEGDDVTFDGECYDVEDASINPKADIDRICIGGGAEPAVRRAGRMGDAWAAAPQETVADLERKLSWFEAAGGGDVLLRRDALLLENGDRAREIADEMLAEGYRGLDESADCLLVGDAEDAAAEMESLAEAGVDEVVVRPMNESHAEETLRECGRAGDLV